MFWDSALVGRLTESRSGLSFAYEAIDSPMISVSMPPTRRPYGDSVARPYFHGLLPEGEARRIIAYDLGLRTEGGTDLEMLAALGRDCAGALVITDGTRPPTDGDDDSDEPSHLSEADIVAKLRDLPYEPLGITDEVRVSLTGMQPKLPLTRLTDGRWVLPSSHRPSTHILKPPSQALPDSVPNEVFCMRLARELGVIAATTELVTFGDVPALVSTRYDRRTADDGSITRAHQEDGCQALSIPVGSPRAKYQRADSGPSLAAIAALLDRWGPTNARYELLDHAFVTMAVGDADLHGKNVSLLHEPGVVRLAPMYDMMSTVGLSVIGGQSVSTTLGMYIGGATDVRDLGIGDLLNEANAWGLHRSRAERRIERLLDALPDAIEAAADGVPTIPEDRVEIVRRRAKGLRSERT